MYRDNKYEFFAKVGALLENTKYNIDVPNTYIKLNGNPFYFTIAAHSVLNDLLPEIKVWVTYDISPQWGASIAYMHAFGDTFAFNASTYAISAGQQVNVSSGIRGSTINTVQFGVRYQFVN